MLRESVRLSVAAGVGDQRSHATALSLPSTSYVTHSLNILRYPYTSCSALDNAPWQTAVAADPYLAISPSTGVDAQRFTWLTSTRECRRPACLGGAVVLSQSHNLLVRSGRGSRCIAFPVHVKCRCLPTRRPPVAVQSRVRCRTPHGTRLATGCERERFQKALR